MLKRQNPSSKVWSNSFSFARGSIARCHWRARFICGGGCFFFGGGKKMHGQKILPEGFLGETGETCFFFGKALRSFWNFVQRPEMFERIKEFTKWFVHEFWKTFRSRSTFWGKKKEVPFHYHPLSWGPTCPCYPCSSMPLEAAFQKYDVDNSGLLEPMEFCRALHVAWWLKELCQTLLSLWWDWLIGMWVGVPTC